MAKDKEKDIKTNAMRILETLGISYEVITYECDEFIDGVHLADKLGQPKESTFKTLVAQGKSGGYFAFVIPVAEELDLKAAARAVGEKAVELIPVKDITKVTGYIRGGCTAIGMKKDYPTVIDETCVLFDKIMVSGGRIGSQMILTPDDYIKATKAKCLPIIF
ncbi:MAG: Cys-tRNA(Pro) deacylase [Clostridia bacterium]|nr:Cys-tRNA(Pro) deacylase [Clostridia bacterium]